MAEDTTLELVMTESNDNMASQMRQQMKALSAAPPNVAPFEARARPTVDLVNLVGYADRLPITTRSLSDIARESVLGGYRIRNLIFVNFGLAQNALLCLRDLARDFQKAGLIQNSMIAETSKGSAARSFNVGVQRICQTQEPADVTVKVDDDSRYAPGVFAALVNAVVREDMSLVAPLTIRPAHFVDYADDEAFARLCQSERHTGDLVHAPPFVTPGGKLHLANIYMGLNMNGAPIGTPTVPNENGHSFSKGLILDLMREGNNLIYSEGAGSEGTRLLAVLTVSEHAKRVGTLRLPVYDRIFGIDPGQTYAWGVSDAESMAAMLDLDLISKSLCYSGCDRTTTPWQIYSGEIAHPYPLQVKGVEASSWAFELVTHAKKNGLYDKMPDWAREHLPILHSELESLQAIIEANRERMPREIWGQTHPDSPQFARTEVQALCGIMHLVGNSMRSAEMGRPVQFWNTWC